MNKRALIDAVAARTGEAPATVVSVVDAFLDELVRVVATEGKIKLMGFGVFEARDRRARPARDLRTGERVMVPPTRVPFFRPGKGFREAVRRA